MRSRHPANGSRRRLPSSITIERQGEARNEMNELTAAAWAPLLTVRARAYPAPGTEKYANATNAASAPTLFEIRDSVAAKTILPSDRIAFDGRRYNIVSIEQPESGSNIRIGAVADI